MSYFDYRFPYINDSWSRQDILNEYENLSTHIKTQEQQTEYLKSLVSIQESQLQKYEQTIKKLEGQLQLSQSITHLPQEINQCQQIIEQKLINNNGIADIHESQFFRAQELIGWNDETLEKWNNVTQLDDSLRTIIFTCCVCNQSISSQFIILKCDHIYHYDCMERHMKQQLTENPKCVRFRCACRTIIPQQCYTSSHMPNVKQLVKQLHQNQVQQIIEMNPKYKFHRCQKVGCEFVYIQQDGLNIKNSWCSLCLEYII